MSKMTVRQPLRRGAQPLAAKNVTEIAALDGMGLRREEMARLTGFSLRAVADWIAGKTPSEAARRRLSEVERLIQALGGIVRRDALAPWLRAPNSAFGGMTPLQLIENGEIGRLWLMVHELGSGEPG